MYTRSIKGQGLIGEIIIFGVVIFFSFAIFFLLSSEGDTQYEESTDVKVEENMESIRQRSALTSMLNGYVWRAPDVDNRYDDLKAIDLTSYYLSVDGDIFLKGESYSRDQVKNDLESYYEYRMRQNFLNTPKASDHALNITYQDKKLEVENIDDRGGSWSSIEVPIQLSNGRTGEITMYAKGTGGVFSVE